MITGGEIAEALRTSAWSVDTSYDGGITLVLFPHTTNETRIPIAGNQIHSSGASIRIAEALEDICVVLHQIRDQIENK